LLIGENFSHWTYLSLKVAVYVYGKNIDGEHKIFDINTKRFFLVRDDIDQCLTALRTQSVSKEILDAVNVLMPNAKKRPPSSEIGNTMNSNPSNDDTAHQILLCVPCCPPKKKVRTCKEADCTKNMVQDARKEVARAMFGRMEDVRHMVQDARKKVARAMFGRMEDVRHIVQDARKKVARKI
jgi:hypothetical protein